MPNQAHRNLVASERHPVPRYEFATLGAAQGYTYSSNDISCFVRVGSTGPYTHYMVVDVTAGVAELVEIGGTLEFGTTAGTACEGNDPRLIDVNDYAVMWDPDAPPETPHADDDECDGSSIAGAWTAWDPRGYITFSADSTKGWYRASATGDGTSDWGGRYKAIPNSVFSITSKVSLHHDGPSVNAVLGLFAGDFSAGETGASVFVGLNTITGAQGSVGVTRGALSNTVTGTPTLVSVTTRTPTHIRLRVNGTSISTDASYDGGYTYNQFDTTTLGSSPTHCGLIFRVLSNGATAAGMWHWVRFASGAGSDDVALVPPGRLIRRPLV